MNVRSPHLYSALRSFCLAAFAVLAAETAGGDEIAYVLDEHDGLYTYRALLRDRVAARAPLLGGREDARIAIAELDREPAAAIFGRGSGGDPIADERFVTILIPLVTETAEACGGFDWDDGAFNRVYAALEQSLFGDRRLYRATAPLVGISVGAPIELGGASREIVEPSELCELQPAWAHSLPAGFGETPERSSVLTLARRLPAGATRLPDAARELAGAVTALRLATGAALAAGPVILEELDGRPLTPRPSIPNAVTEPGEPTRLDPWRGKLAADLLGRLSAADRDLELGDAIERWELAFRETEPHRGDRLREALGALLGGADGLWAAGMRAAVLVGGGTDERLRLAAGLRRLIRGGEADPDLIDALRRALVEATLHGDRRRLLEELDEALLGLRSRPAGYLSAPASAA